jgi:flavin-dependent dehydrogenase
MTVRADVVVLGAGPAGTVVAKRLAADGADVAVVTGPPPAAAREGYSRRTLERLRADLEPPRAVTTVPDGRASHAQPGPRAHAAIRVRPLPERRGLLLGR